MSKRLSNCLGKIVGKLLDAPEGERIQADAAEYRSEGRSVVESDQMAVRDAQREIEGNIQEVLDQAGKRSSQALASIRSLLGEEETAVTLDPARSRLVNDLQALGLDRPMAAELLGEESPWLKVLEDALPEKAEDGWRQLGRLSLPPDAEVREVGNATVAGPATMRIKAFHGTPHKVDRFSLDKIGTGEGAQAYGWGLYFAEEPKVAEEYAKALSAWKLRQKDGSRIDTTGLSKEAVKLITSGSGGYGAPDIESWHRALQQDAARALRWADQGSNPDSNRAFAKGVEETIAATTDAMHVPEGNTYTVELAVDPETLLDWDKPLTEQSEKVKAALQQAGLFKEYTDPVVGMQRERKGVQLYGDLAADLSEEIPEDRGWTSITNVKLRGDKPVTAKGEQAASARLREAGIPGIRYLDGQSRSPGQGTYNYVVFDESAIRIVAENGKPVEGGLLGLPTQAATIEQTAFPKDRRAQLFALADAMEEEKITTPAAVAAYLDDISQGKARKYAQALWDTLAATGHVKSAQHDWSAIYGEIDGGTEDAEKEIPSNEKLGAEIERILSESETLTRAQLTQLAKGTDLSPKEVDEIAEAAVVRVARSIVNDRKRNASPATIFNSLLDLYQRQPNLTAKTSTSKIQQAYSTPIPLGYVGSRLAEVAEGGVMQESTAGNGALAVEADPKTALLNEINPTRAAALRAQGFTVSEEDATTWTPERKAKRININPPFGQIRGEDGEWQKWTVDGLTTTQIDHAISLQTLANMEDDGSAVLIIGGTQAQKESERVGHYGLGDRGEFFRKLYADYGVIDHFTVDGDLYKKQGAGWPVDVIVIRGRKVSPIVLPNVQSPRILLSWDEVREELSRSDDERTQINQYDEERARRELGNDLAGVRGAFAGGGRSDLEGDSSNASGESGAVGSNSTAGDRGQSRDVPAEEALQSASERAGNVGRGAADREQPGVANDPNAPAVFHAPYRPVAKGKAFGIETPINLAEPQRDSLERLEKEVGPLAEYVAGKLGYEGGTDLSPYFAAEQLDALALAVYNIESGGSLIVGDMAGIGKGRVAAGLIEYAKQNGLVPIFVTKEPKLYSAMLGDVNNIGRAVAPVMTNSDLEITNPIDNSNIRQGSMRRMMEQISQGGQLPEGKDVVFTTYDQIGKEFDPTESKESRDSAKNSGGTPRPGPRNLALQSLVNSGKALFILDESHLAAGDSIVGRRMKNLIGKASVYYSSATFSKRPDAMPLYFRTNLRLATTGGIDSLVPVFDKGGVVMQQVATQMLAQDGQLLRRERSYKGVTFETHINFDTEERDRKLGDQYTRGLRELMGMSRKIERATKSFNGVMAKLGKKLGVSMIKLESADFASQVHNFVAQYLFSIKAEAAVQQAARAIKQGHPTQDGTVKPHKVIIALQNTMQSPISALAESGMPVSFNGLLLKALEGLRTVTDGKGANKRTMTIGRKADPRFENMTAAQLEGAMIERKTVEVNGVAQEVGTVNEGMAMEYFRRLANREFEQAEEQMNALDLGDMPISPIDYIIQRLEAQGIRTGEITGRSRGFRDGKTFERDPQEVTKQGQLRTLDQFNNSNLDAMIINASGSTGVSAHASETFRRKDPRMMIIVQPHLDINEFIQTLGRIFRSGQVELPRYMLLQTALPAEKRPAAITGKKMAALNANTTSNADSEVSSGANVVDMFNEYGDEVVWRYLADNPGFRASLNWPKIVDKNGGLLPLEAIREVMEGEHGKLSRSTASYAAILSVDEQEAFWDKVVADYTAMITYLDQIGENKMRVAVEDIGAETVESSTYTEGNPGGKSVFDKPSFLESVKIKPKQPPYELEEVERLGRTAASRMDETLTGFKEKASAFAADYLKRRAERTPEGWEEMEPKEKTRLNEQASAIASGIRLLGKPVLFNTIEGKRVAVVTGFEMDEKNPLTPSKQTVILSTNTLKREIKMPVSQLAERVSPLEQDVLEEQFNESLEDKTGRQIITGNLVAAFAKLGGVGKVVTYSKSDGSTAVGIMLPNGFDASAESAERLLKPAQILSSLKDGQDVQSRDGAIRFELREGDKIEMRVPSSKSAGGRFWQDPAINRAMRGGEMAQSGVSMVGTVSDLKAIMGRLDEMKVELVARGQSSLGLPGDDYAHGAAAVWLDHAATDSVKPTEEEKQRIQSAYAKVRSATGFDAVPIADVMEGAGFSLADVEHAKGLLASMLRSGEVQTFSRGDWSLSDFRKRAWGLNDRARTAYEAPSLMVRMSEGGSLGLPEDSTQPNAEKLASLKAAVAELPAVQRKVLTMRIAKKDGTDIQKATGLTANGVENAYQIAIQKMRAAREKALSVEGIRKEAMAAVEEGGKKTMGRPELSNPAKGPASRIAMDAVDEARKRAGVPGVRKDADVEQEAIARLDADFEGEKARLIDRGRSGGMLSDLETAMAKRIVARGTLRWVRQKDENSILEGVMMADAWRVTGTEQARAFRMRRDSFLTPAQRFAEFVSEAILTPDRKRQQALDEALKDKDMEKRERILRDWVKRLEALKRKLKALGVDLDNMSDEDLRNLSKNGPKAQATIRAIQTAKADTFDKVYEYWIMSVLSGIGSNAANVAGNVANASFDLSLQRMVEAGVNLVVNDPKSARFGEFSQMLKGIAPGWTRAARNMAMAWSSESPVFEEDVLGEPGSAKLEGRRGAIGGKLGRVIRVPGRLLTAMDDWSKSMVGTIQVQAEAYRIGTAENLKGDALAKRLAQLTMTPTEAALAKLKSVKDETVEGKALALAGKDKAAFADRTSDAWEQARRIEAYRLAEEDGYSPAAWERSVEKATELSFQEDLGPIGRSLMNARREYPLLGYVFPFVKTMSNILRVGFRKTPLGSVPLLYKVLRSGAAQMEWGGQNFTYTRGQFVRDFAEQLIAWGAFFALKALTVPDDKEGIPSITGTTPFSPQNRGKRELAYRTAPPTSIRIGGRWYNYSRIEPFATALAVTVDMMNAVDEPGGDLTKKVGDLFAHLSGQLQEKTFAKGIGDIMRALQDGESTVEWAANFATSWVPNLIRQSARETDAMVREGKIWGNGDEWKDRLEERTLWKALPIGTNAPPPKVNLWGEDIKKDTWGGPATDFLARVLIPVRTQKAGDIHQIDRMILNWNNQNPGSPYAPQQPAPAWTITRKGKTTTIAMSDSQYHDFLQMAGQMASARLQGAPFNVQNPTEADMKQVVDTIAKSRKAAREAVWQQKLSEMQ